MADEALPSGQFLAFQIGTEEYGVGILKVREILKYDEITRIPGAPAAVRGVINLRGNVVPVIDLARKFGLGETPVSKLTCIVVVEVEDQGTTNTLGVLADAVNQVLDLTADQVEATPEFGLEGRLDYLRGMGRLGKKFLLILDVDKVLSSAELRRISKLAAAESPAESSAEAPAAAAGGAEPAGV
jgi:purine-binding chemotaxis protein CheW